VFLQEFLKLKAEFGTHVAFHGSATENWFCIVNTGLRNFSGTEKQRTGAIFGEVPKIVPFFSAFYISICKFFLGNLLIYFAASGCGLQPSGGMLASRRSPGHQDSYCGTL
jgi:hypothetical protein